ncbi:hypothetical protein N0V83_007868 [Neocucurbitaria cava]|uniref:Uncharacterized protein n=1 Tax=Neocucurbitaria cava TaxID=798079 RepID=A0A9W8Y3I8_9PLEO|nr:hypothetical protein N0V83_007868 [Neocucurbitaria cava]
MVARFSSCLRMLVEHKARIVKMLENLESNLEQRVDIPSQGATPDQTGRKTPNNRSDEKARINTNTASHLRRASASSGSNDTSQKCTSDMERSMRSKESNPRRHSGPGLEVLYKSSTNVSDSASEKQRDGAGKDESDIDDDELGKGESKRKSHGEESNRVSIQGKSQEGASDSASNGDSEVSEYTFSQDESEESACRSRSDSGSDTTEKNFSQDKTGESGSSSNPNSDVKDDANSASTDVRNVTKDDIA